MLRKVICNKSNVNAKKCQNKAATLKNTRENRTCIKWAEIRGEKRLLFENRDRIIL